jgi:alpha-tubulin suppressor-like RCC1 family protein
VARPGNRSITVSWTPSATGAGYTVLRSLTADGPFFAVTTPAQFSTPTTYVDPGLSNGTTYFYTVQALNSFGTSGRSAVVQATPAFKAVQIAAGPGYSHLEALLPDGSVWQWGAITPSLLTDVPSFVPGLPDIVGLSGGSQHVLALGSDGTVWAWGDNSFGQLGIVDTETTPVLTPIQVPNLSGVIALAAGGTHSVALLNDGTVWAWGDNSKGQLGTGSTSGTPMTSPVQVPGLTQITTLSAGVGHTLALRADGLLFTWGANDSGQLGLGTSSATSTPSALEVPNLTGVIAIAAGANHSLALESSGTVWAWGANTTGEIGNGISGAAPVTKPVQVPGLIGVTAIAGGGEHSLAVKGDGTVWAWGDNTFGQLGNGTTGTTPITSPVQVVNLSGAAFVAAGEIDSVALGTDGTVWTWGNNTGGELGNGTGEQEVVPSEVANLTGVAVTAGGGLFTLIVKQDGTVWGWGANNIGQLGNGLFPATASPTAVQATGISGVTMLDGGNDHSLAIGSGGTLWAWGYNSTGQIGNGTVSNGVSPPFQVTAVPGVIAISAGVGHSLAVKSDGTVWAFGDNSQGQVGSGAPIGSVLTPVQVPGLAGMIAVSAGVNHSLSLKSDGTVWAWGDNTVGQLGNGTTSATPSPSPAQVPNLTGIVAISGKANSGLALRSDGTVWSWGENSNGELGTGRPDSEYSPVQVVGLTEVTAIAGGGHVLALRSDGSVWAWGSNGVGQLGNPSTTLSRVPIPVLGLAGVSAISTGAQHSLALLNNQTLWVWGGDDHGQLGRPLVSFSSQPVPLTR